MGFNYSRPDKKYTFTDGPSADSAQLDYQHPQYLKGYVRYKPEFDYFSLGLVLLEIGLWKTLGSQNKKLPAGSGPEELYDMVVQRLVPKLGVPMGSCYQAVVHFCLCGEGDEWTPAPNKTSEAENSIQRQMRFEEMVVTQLEGCFEGVR